MRNKLRNLGLLLSLTVFVSTVSGLVLSLHLYESQEHECHDEEHDQKHDEQDCSTCQHLAITSKQYLSEANINIIIDIEKYIITPAPQETIFVKTIIEPFTPRPPPSASTS